MATKGLLLVMSGPSGAGKGTLCQALLERRPNLRFSVSATTRPRRAGEVDGVHYFFLTEDEFREGITQGRFLEWARVYGHLYGTPLEGVRQAVDSGVDVLLDLDIQGARQVKDKMPDAISVFISPPSLEALRERIQRRGTETDEESRLRLGAAITVMTAAREFDYIIVNDDLSEAGLTLDAILTAERARTSRHEDFLARFVGVWPGETKGEKRG